MNSPAKTRVFVATSRGQDASGFYDRSRSTSPTYLETTISLPANRRPGDAPAISNRPDFAEHYVVADQRQFDSADELATEIRRASRTQSGGGSEVVVFVHGFYNSYAHSLFRVAQIKQDLGVTAPVVNFSWPSAGRALAYNYDSESVLFARDDLEKLLLALSRKGPDRLVLVGHSRGSLLITEALRQMEIRSPGWSERNLSGLLFIAPDMPVEVFLRSMEQFKSVPTPFMIMAARNDRALRLSSRVNSSNLRLGQITDPTELGDLPITLIDVSKFSMSGNNNHMLFAESAALISLVRDRRALRILTESLDRENLKSLEKSVQVVGEAVSVQLVPTDSSPSR
ncbi:alpha/beta hydrolase [Shimia isoporae]|nr:alpha/beta fold hydrolase [Shimia isoporae]